MTLRKQRVTVLGSTGSVGVNTLDVIAGHPDRFEVFALNAATQTELLLEQCVRFKPHYAVMVSEPHARALAQHLKEKGLETHVLIARDALETIASDERVDTVMAAIVGAAGLAPCLAAARAGKRLLLANKEALVVGGEVFMHLEAATGRAVAFSAGTRNSLVVLPLALAVPGSVPILPAIIVTDSGGAAQRAGLRAKHLALGPAGGGDRRRLSAAARWSVTTQAAPQSSCER